MKTLLGALKIGSDLRAHYTRCSAGNRATPSLSNWLIFRLCSGHAVLSSLPLQMMLYFNAFYLPFWILSEGVMLELKVTRRPIVGCVLSLAYK